MTLLTNNMSTNNKNLTTEMNDSSVPIFQFPVRYCKSDGGEHKRHRQTASKKSHTIPIHLVKNFY